jgi:hypothetical protein
VSQITGTVAFLGGVTSTFTDVGPFALALTAGTSNTTTNTVPSTFSSIFLTTFGNNLGINCNAPSFTLDVNGSANFNGIVNMDNLPENNVLINSASQQILLSNTNATYMYMQAPGNRIRIGAYSNTSGMPFTINESGGNVSIGSSSTTSFALYLLGRARLAKNVKIVFRGVSFSGGIVRPTITLRFGIQNPTDQIAEIRSIVGQVMANGRTVADISNFVALKLQPNSEAIIPIKAEPSALGIASTVWQYLQSTQREKLQLQFTGTANVDGVNIPIETSATI